MGIRHLLPTLCELGMTDAAYDILTQTDFPSWGYSIVNGATTVWEHWDSNSTERLTQMNSFNHYSLGSCVEWMFEYCLGIRPDARVGGFKEITLRPYIDTSGRLTSARGYYDSPYGRISVSWEIGDGGCVLKTEIPSEIKVSCEIPGFDTLNVERRGNSAVFTLKRRK